MTLATRCPRCMTTFRVADAQLRQADGWVRCGRCNEVFKALESMVDLGRSPTPALPARVTTAPSAPSTSHPAPPSPVQRQGLRARLAAQAGPSATTQPDAHTPTAFADRSVAPSAPPGSQPDAAPASKGDTLGNPPQAPPRDALSVTETATAPPQPVASPSSQDMPLPFSRRMHRPARSMSDEARLAWGAVAGFAGLGLAMQMLVAWHDPIGQRVPVLRPLVEVVCVIAECRIEPPRRLAQLSVESSEFHHLAGSIYRLTTRLRNRDGVALSVPSVDLSMTDASGQLVARKVLQPGDLGSRSRSIGAGQELTLQAVLDTGPRGVAGYTIELFYP